MNYNAVKWALAQDVKHSTDKLVLVCLAEAADKNFYCHPGQNAIAQRSCCSVATVRRSLKRLEGIGFICRQLRHKTVGHRDMDGWFLSIKTLPEGGVVI